MVMSCLLCSSFQGALDVGLSFCSSSLFIIRYEGHVDLVTAHKAHFEIVERNSAKAYFFLCSSFSRLQFSILDDKDVTIVCKKLSTTILAKRLPRCEKAQESVLQERTESFATQIFSKMNSHFLIASAAGGRRLAGRSVDEMTESFRDVHCKTSDAKAKNLSQNLFSFFSRPPFQCCQESILQSLAKHQLQIFNSAVVRACLFGH